MSELTVERRPAEEVFGLLGNELRVDILRALADGDGLSFSQLRDRVGEPDSGKFNYHLRQLLGTFVRDGEAGYELTLAGERIVGAVIAGTYTADAALPAVAVDDPCPVCGVAELYASYEDERARVVCRACDEWQNTFPFPPGTLDQYDPAELPAAFDRWMRAQFEQVTAGFCTNCAGRLTGELEPEDAPPTVVYRCDRCGDTVRAAVAMPVLFHPATRGFLYDHGVDPSTTPSWRLLTWDDLEQSADAEGALVRLSLDGEMLSGRLDAAGQVTSVEREGTANAH
ncbi:winged helix-turn-helix domain-containing protein [Halosegnis sp.]|uniref:winged helix-turn-helix domain-containing protein n=1 Tax=Halosegnis sp. TaxID=2864959 RepID=UPI0035D4C7E1